MVRFVISFDLALNKVSLSWVTSLAASFKTDQTFDFQGHKFGPTGSFMAWGTDWGAYPLIVQAPFSYWTPRAVPYLFPFVLEEKTNGKLRQLVYSHGTS